MGQKVSAKKSDNEINECCEQYSQSKHCCLKDCLKSSNNMVQLSVNSVNEEYKKQIEECLSKYNLGDCIKCIIDYLNFKSTVVCHDLSDPNFNLDSLSLLDVTENIICKHWLKYIIGQESKMTLRIHVDGIKKSGKTVFIIRSIADRFESEYEETTEQIDYIMQWNEAFQIQLTDVVDPGSFNTNRDEWRQWPHIYIYCICPAVKKDIFAKWLNKMQQDVSDMIELSNYKKDCAQSKHDTMSTAFIVLSTKCDLKDQVYITNQQSMIEWCQQSNVPMLEISGKESINIRLFFNLCIHEYWCQTQINCV